MNHKYRYYSFNDIELRKLLGRDPEASLDDYKDNLHIPLMVRGDFENMEDKEWDAIEAYTENNDDIWNDVTSIVHGILVNSDKQPAPAPIIPQPYIFDTNRKYMVEEKELRRFGIFDAIEKKELSYYLCMEDAIKFFSDNVIGVPIDDNLIAEYKSALNKNSDWLVTGEAEEDWYSNTIRNMEIEGALTCDLHVAPDFYNWKRDTDVNDVVFFENDDVGFAYKAEVYGAESESYEEYEIFIEAHGDKLFLLKDDSTVTSLDGIASTDAELEEKIRTGEIIIEKSNWFDVKVTRFDKDYQEMYTVDTGENVYSVKEFLELTPVEAFEYISKAKEAMTK